MRTKRVFAGLTLLLIVALVVWRRSDRTPAGGVPRQATLATDARPTRFAVEAPSGLVTLERPNGDWLLTTPVRARADPSAVAPLIAGLESLRPGKIAAADRSQPGPFGLDASTIVVRSTWVTPSGTTTERVDTIGASVAGGTYFSSDDDPRVFLGPEGLRELFSKPYTELRDRTVFAFEPAGVRGLFVQMGGQRWFVERTNGGWKRTKPTDGPADPASIEQLLTLLAGAKARDYVDDRRPSDTAALAALGFSSPSALVTLVMTSGSRTLLVAESDANGGHRVYAREAAGGPVMVVDGAVLETLRTAMASGATDATAPPAPVDTPAP